MQTLTWKDMVVIEDYYPLTILDENMCWMKLTRLLSVFLKTLGLPFVNLPLPKSS